MDYRRILFAVFCTAVVFQMTLASAKSPSSYLQIYPPVNGSDGRTPLYFALMLSFGGDYTSIGALPGVQIALDYVNRQPSILPGYSLHYTLTDSQVYAITCFDLKYTHQIIYNSVINSIDILAEARYNNYSQVSLKLHRHGIVSNFELLGFSN